MKRLAIIPVALLFGIASAYAGAPKTYQVTGPVLEVKDDMIVVQKDKEKWEIARSADTKIKGGLKVGATVTVKYRMAADSIDVKEEKKK